MEEKKKRGRPRKNPDNVRMEVEEKKPRGRPKKIQLSLPPDMHFKVGARGLKEDLEKAHEKEGKIMNKIIEKKDPCWEGYEQLGMKTGKKGKKVPNCVPEGKGLYDSVKGAYNKAVDIVDKVKNGRMAYPPSAQKILNQYGEKKIARLDLHRCIVPEVYTNILNVWSQGELKKRLAEEPKDKLYHISIWVHLEGGTTILCEKNEVIHLKVNPKTPKGEETQTAKTPSVSFGELMEKGRQLQGDDKWFSYSAKNNNCGNWIEGILMANHLDDKATHDFIGQDADKILEGFPNMRKFVNTLTDIAGKANVVIEGGKLSHKRLEGYASSSSDSDRESDSDSDYEKGSGLNIDFDDLKWGSFTKQFERFKHTNSHTGIKDLEGFARHIVADPKHYNKTTLKRARFYLNVLLKSHHNKMKGKGLDDHLPSANKDDRQTLWKGGSSYNEIFGPHKGGVRVDIKGSGMGTNSGPAVGSSRTGTIPYAPTPYFSHQTMAGGSIHTHHHHYYHPMSGMGVFDSLDPRLNGVADAFDPRSNGVMSSVENLVSTGKSAATNAIGKLKSSVRPGIKKTVSAGIDELSGMPGTGSLVGMLGLNNAIDQGVSKLNLGLGLKKPHMVKGSAEAKEHMAKIRAMRGKK